jgi:hypothetical protein
MTSSTKMSHVLVPNTYAVLERAVEEGVAYGYTRAFKYTDNPTDEQIQQAVQDAVLNSILEWFNINDSAHLDDLK